MRKSLYALCFGSFLFGMYTAPSLHAQTDTLPPLVLLREAIALGLRPGVAFEQAATTLSDSLLQERADGRDLPFVLEQTPSVVSTSDAGNGVGYTGLRIRGIDQSRINVSLNGIPLNDAESQSVFWVNTPDLVSGLKSARVQRGLGSSANGPAVFGASLNLSSLGASDTAFAAYRFQGGSFATLGHRLQFGTGRIGKGLRIEAGFSTQESEGFVDRGFSELRGYQAKADWEGSYGLFQATAFGGRERTGQAWYGLDSLTALENPRFNYAGALYDSLGNIKGFYDNETDNYGQDHLQLHWSRMFRSGWKLSAALHQTLGAGYYEQYIPSTDAATYGLDSTVGTTDVVRRLWLDNRFYGGIFQAERSTQSGRWLIGLNGSHYSGLHYGSLEWAQNAGNSALRDRFYENRSLKEEYSGFVRREQKLNGGWGLSVDLQIRSVSYRGSGTDLGPTAVQIEDNLLFFNPKAALSYQSDPQTFWVLAYGRAQREGNRADYLASGSGLEPEMLHDFEFEHRKSTEHWDYAVGGFWMEYRDQLALTGEIDNVGGFVRRNVGSSYRTGIEVESRWKPNDRWSWSANATWALHRNRDYRQESLTGTIDYGNSPLAYAPEWMGGSVLRYQSEGWIVAWSLKAVGSQFLDNTGRARMQLNAYVLNDLRLEYRWAWGASRWNAGLDVLNALDVRYASNGYVFDEVAYYYPQAGRNALFRVGVEL